MSLAVQDGCLPLWIALEGSVEPVHAISDRSRGLKFSQHLHCLKVGLSGQQLGDELGVRIDSEPGEVTVADIQC